MKKSVLRFLIAAGALVLFAGCSNFFSGSELKKDIESEIKIANAETKIISISVINNNVGVVTQEGKNDKQIGVPFKVDFSVNSGYSFYKWGAFKKSDLSLILEKFYSSLNKFVYKEQNDCVRSKEDIDKLEEIIIGYDSDNKPVLKYVDGYAFQNYLLDESFVQFEDKYAANTKATVLSEEFEIVIVPLCVQRQGVLDFSNDSSSTLYPMNAPFLIEFKSPVVRGAFITGKLYQASAVYANQGEDIASNVKILNPEYIKIIERPHKNSTQSIDITRNFAVIENEGKLKIGKWNKILSISNTKYVVFVQDGSSYEPTELWDMAYNKIYNDEIYPLDIGSNDFETRYIEVQIEAGVGGYVFLDDFLSNKYSGINDSVSFGFTQTAAKDNDPPRFVDVQYYLPGVDLIHYTGINNGSKRIQYIFNKQELYDGTSGEYDIDWLAKKCKKNFNGDFLPFRVKNTMAFYALCSDTFSKESFASTDVTVDKVYYNFYQITDNQGVKNLNYKNALVYRYVSNGKNSVVSESGISYKKERISDLSQQWYEDFKTTRMDGVVAGFDFSKAEDSFSDGLYILELSAIDYDGNQGYSMYPCETGYLYNGENKETKQNYLRYNSQLYFVKDTTPPETTASDFVFYAPGKFYRLNSSFEDFGFKYDGSSSSQWDADRKIVDAGNPDYNSLFTYRICKILTESEADEWDSWSDEKKLEDAGWRATAHTSIKGDENYLFDEVYGKGDWLPEDFKQNPENYSIYAYVKDDVGNISKQIKIEIPLDYTPPSVTLKEVYKDGDGRCFRFKCNELESGISKIYYSIIDSDGVEYNNPESVSSANQAIYWNGIGWLTKDTNYTVDSENNVIQLKTPAVETGSALIWVYFKDFENATGGTVKFTIEDAAGNKSEEQVINW